MPGATRIRGHGDCNETIDCRLPMAMPRAPRSRPPEPPANTGWLRYAPASEGYALAGRLLPWCWAIAAVSGGIGLVIALLVAPRDFDRGDAYRIAFVQVPAAWMALVNYGSMALWSALGLLLNTRPSFMLAQALAPTGTLMTLLTLWTGALWGRPDSGQWWVWHPRLAAELLLLLLYLAFLALLIVSDGARRAERAAAVLALIGAVNVPLLYYAPAQQAAGVGVGIDWQQLAGMADLMQLATALMVAAFWAWSAGAALHRFRSIVLEREAGEPWVRGLRAGGDSR
jgi:heme exporter protein C